MDRPFLPETDKRTRARRGVAPSRYQTFPEPLGPASDVLSPILAVPADVAPVMAPVAVVPSQVPHPAAPGARVTGPEVPASGPTIVADVPGVRPGITSVAPNVAAILTNILLILRGPGRRRLRRSEAGPREYERERGKERGATSHISSLLECSSLTFRFATR
jgi:hypothetical protein